MACRWAEYSSAPSQTSTPSCTSASAVATARDVHSASVGTVVAPSGPVLKGSRTTEYSAATERVSDSEEDDAAAWGGPKRSSVLPIVTVERSTPHVVVSSDVTSRVAAAAGLLVPADDNGNHEWRIRSYGSRYLCLKYLLALWR